MLLSFSRRSTGSSRVASEFNVAGSTKLETARSDSNGRGGNVDVKRVEQLAVILIGARVSLFVIMQPAAAVLCDIKKGRRVNLANIHGKS